MSRLNTRTPLSIIKSGLPPFLLDFPSNISTGSVLESRPAWLTNLSANWVAPVLACGSPAVDAHSARGINDHWETKCNMHNRANKVRVDSSANTSVQTPRTTSPISALSFPQRLAGLFRDHWQIICLVLISLCMHMYVFSFADRLIYDEKFWVPEARHILEREPLDWPQYTALSKLFMTSGIYILGDNPWGWRTPSAIFGVASIVLVYLIARRLAGKRTALLASLLFTTENLVFTFSGLAMLDVFAVAFMLLSFLLYLHHRYTLSGLSLALAVVCSPKVLLAVFAVLAHWFFVRRKRGLRAIGVFAITSLLAFFILMTITDLTASGQCFNPFHRVVEMWTGQTSIKVSDMTAESLATAHPTRPWWWILNLRATLLEPTEFYHRMMITPTIWLLTIPSIAYLLYRYFFVRKNRNTPRFILLWFSATYLLWIPLELYTDRPLFLFYLLPSMGAICIAVAYGINQAWQRSAKAKGMVLRWSVRALLILYLVFHVGLFLVLSPLVAPLMRQAT